VLQGGVELAPFVAHLGQAHVAEAGQWQRVAGLAGDLHRTAEGPQRVAEMALHLLDMTEVVPGAYRQPVAVADDLGQPLLRLGGAAAQQVRHGEVPVDQRSQRPVGGGQGRHGLPGERGRAVGVPALAGDRRGLPRSPPERWSG
jgi:hypothetical protein